MSNDRKASLPLGVYVSPLSFSHAEDFIDHYAIMELDCWATSEEIKNAHRHLRVKYFKTDLKKYRALQAAFDILANSEARHTYDTIYRSMKGMPVPPPLNSASPPPSTLLATDAQPTRMESPVDFDEVTEAVEKVNMEAEGEKDPNAALKKFTWEGKIAMLGTQPYQSFVPILAAYEGLDEHLHYRCSRPKYVLTFAKNALP